MVSDRLDALVRDEVQRTYLAADDGYWADLVLSEFAFLEDERGGRLWAIGFHQKGDYVCYTGPWGEVVVEFAPDNYPDGKWIFARAALHGPRATFEGELDRLVRERIPGTQPPQSASLDHSTIAANVRLWADVLKAATDLF
jgi:hypothetical protein